MKNLINKLFSRLKDESSRVTRNKFLKLAGMAVGGTALLAAVVLVIALANGESDPWQKQEAPFTTQDEGNPLDINDIGESDDGVTVASITWIQNGTVFVDGPDGIVTMAEPAMTTPKNTGKTAPATTTVSGGGGNEEVPGTTVSGGGNGGGTTSAPKTEPQPEATTSVTAKKQSEYVYISLKGDYAEADHDTSIVEMKEENVEGTKGYRVIIRQPGKYVVSGSLHDGQLRVELGIAGGDVEITLKGVTITNKNGPAIRIRQAEQVILGYNPDGTEIKEPSKEVNAKIINAAGTTNKLIDSRARKIIIDEEDPAYDPATIDDLLIGQNSTLYSRVPLTITGAGRLNITGGYAHGINVRGSTLEVVDTTIDIVSPGNGIRSSHRMHIRGSTINISGDKGLRAAGNTNGIINIVSSTVNIKSTRDGIHANSSVDIWGGNFKIVTDGGWKTGSTISINKKGIRADGNITIDGGEFDLNCSEDAINSSAIVEVKNATMHISTSKAALRASNIIRVLDSNINVDICQDALNGCNIEVARSNLVSHCVRQPLKPGRTDSITGYVDPGTCIVDDVDAINRNATQCEPAYCMHWR